ncbi:hypothetical protein BXZ70DRAFT_1035603 [Cristinia sonorae]|uniref:Ubiquitin carboxyl-terminal hydrolase n=1 Tax=Cristinia sonorae TaxID=1940300 RepID=A0A8K0UKW0_9AGAR|nr:hypothetical protein BXZ70DRAFT_1035603 [Cristinia sonorae]
MAANNLDGTLAVPLESNPEVMNDWAEKAGLVISQDRFYDVLGFDDEVHLLLDLVPKPVKAVILLYPGLDDVVPKMEEEDARIAKEGQHPIDETVVWIKQTIRHWCGTMAILHALINSNVTIAPESPLAKFTEICKGKTGLERAKLLEENPTFATIHNTSANAGQSTVPTGADLLDVIGHFTCFVQAPSPPTREEEIEAPEGAMRIVELNGGRIGPLDRGVTTDFLKDVARFVREGYMKQTTNLGFTMIALAATGSDS